MNDLSKYTDEEIIREISLRFPGRYCIWEDIDVAEKLESRGYEPSKENIEKVWGRAANDWLLENMVEAGYETIDNAIDWVSEELTKAEEE